MDKKEVKPISPEIAEKFKMAKGFNPGKYIHGPYKIDTSTCTAEEAELFLESGSTVLVKIEKEEPKPATPATKK